LRQGAAAIRSASRASRSPDRIAERPGKVGQPAIGSPPMELPNKFFSSHQDAMGDWRGQTERHQPVEPMIRCARSTAMVV